MGKTDVNAVAPEVTVVAVVENRIESGITAVNACGIVAIADVVVAVVKGRVGEEKKDDAEPLLRPHLLGPHRTVGGFNEIQDEIEIEKLLFQERL